MDVLFRIEPTETFTQILEDTLDHLYDIDHTSCDKIFDNTSIKAAKDEIKNIILETNLNTNEVNEMLSSKSYDDVKQQIFISHLERKKRNLLNLTVLNFNCAYGETVVSFDWKLKLVSGTSELKTLSYTLVQLALHTVTRDHKPAVRLYEFNKNMLKKFIGTLEDIVGDNIKTVNNL